ncbi:wax ester/triacylglycerol synthase domain-containing protein [Streptomyces sp. YS-3]|uniref:wax ester/triacylglycerol synthase domain-containing protein n=1 Tax=Streptomyces sp. YS-3 TaxID=3381352 RepID=UPI0038626F81
MKISTALAPVEEFLCGTGALPEPPSGMAVLFTGPPPSLDDLCERVAERWSGIPLLHRTLLRPARHLWLRRHRWLPLDDFDVRTHVLDVHAEGQCGDGGLDDRAFADLLGRLVTQPVPGGLPPWWLRLVRLEPRPDGDERFALVLSAHHALMDGRSFETLLSKLLDGGSSHGDKLSAARATAARRLQAARSEGQLADHRISGTDRLLLLLSSGQALPLPSEAPCPTRDLTWVDLDTDTVRAARRALPGLGATLNELLLAASTGALRAVHGDPDAWPGIRHRPLYGVLSVDLRTPQEDETLGNIVSVVRVPLPLTVESPGERLAACRALLAASVFGNGAETIARVIGAASRLGPWALRRLSKRANSPSWNPVLCTALRWPRGPWSLSGAPLERVIPLAPAEGRGSVNLVLTDCAGVFTLCVVSHTPAGYAQALADAFVRELTSLARIGRPDPSAPAQVASTPSQHTG